MLNKKDKSHRLNLIKQLTKDLIASFKIEGIHLSYEQALDIMKKAAEKVDRENNTSIKPK